MSIVRPVGIALVVVLASFAAAADAGLVKPADPAALLSGAQAIIDEIAAL
jgi:hypothetical protein